MKKLMYFFILIVFIVTTVFNCKFRVDPVTGIRWAIFASNHNKFADVPIVYSIVVGENGKVLTSDGRPPAQWTERQSGVTQDLFAVDGLIDSTIAFAVGEHGAILRSTDKGHTWHIINSPNSGFPNLYGVDIIPTQTGLSHIMAVGNNGKVVMSTTSGANWGLIDRSINTTKKLNSIAVAYNLICAVVGDSGAIYRTLDGGVTWENRSVSVGISLKRVISTRYDRYCAVGSNGVIFTSTDYGFSWIQRPSNTTKTFRDVMFTGLDSGTAVGNEGTVRLTTNGGLNWFSDSFLSGLTTKSILSIAKIDENTINSVTSDVGTNDKPVSDSTFFLAVSSDPFIGIEPISNMVAVVFGLKQNYPNPFNPVTKIRFDVPANVKAKKSNVKIIIYDINGKEIEILVNEVLRPGQYEIQWNGAKFASGVYFYKIVSDVFSETRKMVLIK